MKTILLGGGGQLATDLEEALADAPVTALPHSELDVCDFNEVRRVLGAGRPDVVINTAAFYHVDNCEDEWQKAFDELEWFQNPNDYADGIITLVPPRRIEDVLVLRARMMPICRDLLASFDPETAALLRRVKDEGVTALETPF